MIDQEIAQQFDALSATGIDEALEFLHANFLKTGQYHRMFDVLKMKTRRTLGLSLLHSPSDPPLDESTQTKLETGLLEACREVAKRHMDEGNLNEAWAYLQPLGDEPFAQELIENLEVTDDNFGSIVEVAFNNGISPQYGYKVMLERSGTCNGITAFDVHAMQFDSDTVSALASTLLNHFYDELLANVIVHVEKVSGNANQDSSLDEFLEQHDWLVREGGHHADATHLASVIRIAKQTTTTKDHKLARSLANYGCRLGEDFQFASDPPFEDLYEDHRIWFEALTGKDQDNAIAHFSNKAEEARGQYHQTAAAEALVDLQIRTDRRDDAVDSAARLLFKQIEPDDLPPSAFEIAKSATQFGKVAETFRETGNFAGYAFAKLCQAESSQ